MQTVIRRFFRFTFYLHHAHYVLCFMLHSTQSCANFHAKKISNSNALPIKVNSAITITITSYKLKTIFEVISWSYHFQWNHCLISYFICLHFTVCSFRFSANDCFISSHSTGNKYIPEIFENVYKVVMKLTIASVDITDFGTYKCVAKNSLGETDGSIKLYRKYSVRNRFSSAICMPWHCFCFGRNGKFLKTKYCDWKCFNLECKRKIH